MKNSIHHCFSSTYCCENHLNLPISEQKPNLPAILSMLVCLLTDHGIPNSIPKSGLTIWWPTCLFDRYPTKNSNIIACTLLTHHQVSIRQIQIQYKLTCAQPPICSGNEMVWDIPWSLQVLVWFWKLLQEVECWEILGKKSRTLQIGSWTYF